MKCDKEIGKPGKWHQCKAQATVVVESKTVRLLFLNYCAKHAPAAQGSQP